MFTFMALKMIDPPQAPSGCPVAVEIILYDTDNPDQLCLMFFTNEISNIYVKLDF